MKKEQILNRSCGILDCLAQACYTDVIQVQQVQKKLGSYPLEEAIPVNDNRSSSMYECCKRDDTWGGVDGHTWFYYDLNIPKEYAGHEIVGMVSTGATDIWNTDNPQILVYHNGELDATLDMNHQEFFVQNKAVEGQLHSYSFYAYSNTAEKSNFFQLRFAVFHREVYDLYYDMKTIQEALVLADEEASATYEAMEALHNAIQILDVRKVSSASFYQSVKEARQSLRSYYETIKEEAVTVYGIGHTHIDVAWKWTVEQTRQKVVRSFLTVLNLMEEYPEYVFMSSQPQLYEFVKEDAPKVYEQIKQRVKEGRWEAEGAMWLEADCNLSSGESIVRHILHGTHFMKEEFGVEKQEILWLPDVFGYTAALPQIMEKSGIRYFMTTKIAWNDTNKMPNDVMYWKGIDGSEVLTYFITTSDYKTQPRQKELERFETTYNGRMNPNQVKGTWQRFSNKELSKDVLTCYGYGDGGGGTTREMLEYSRRMKKGICGVPKVKLAKAADFFHKIESTLTEKKVPTWNGELYLEYHRGTYTSMADIKRNNRKAEISNLTTEALNVLANRCVGKNYPKQQLHKLWKLTLLNQFHDIIPGTSIKEVYEVANAEYKEHKKLQTLLEQHCFHSLVGDVTELDASNYYAVFNGLGRARGGLIYLDDQTPAWYDGTISGFGLKVLDRSQLEFGDNETLLTNMQTYEQDGTTELHFETPCYKVTLSATGELVRLYDKKQSREVLQDGKTGNRICVFEDRPKEYDAWNIDSYYEEKHWEFNEVESFEVIENTGIRATIQVKKTFLDSTLIQRIRFYKHSPRIDFDTQMEWKEHQLLCKVEFPIDVLASKATYDIQFGNVERPTHNNTSWEEAMFEVCAHKWADVSEYGYGVALLNDCKYGYDIQGATMRLTLLKSGIFPNPQADQGTHTFTYSLLPHQGDFREGRVNEEAYELNTPFVTYPVKSPNKHIEYAGAQVEESHVVLETCKAMEDEQGFVLRLYEAHGKRGMIHLTIPMFENMEYCIGNLLEQPETVWKPIENTQIQYVVQPYEIVTILLKDIKTNE